MQPKLGQIRDQSKSPDYGSNQTIIKSQKILNSVSNFHVKTQQQDRGDEDHRSPDINRVQKNEIREHNKHRPKMPYKKLPDVFSQPKQKKQYSNKISKQDVMRNWDMMIQNNQSKQTRTLLRPLQFNKRDEEKKREAGENRNPLIPFRKYIQAASKIHQDLLSQDFTSQKLRLHRLTQQSISINECVTLQVIKRGHNTGTVKKMLHVPTLKLVCVRQQPLNTKQSRHLIKDWVSMWQTKLNHDELPFVNVYSAYYNYPQGAVSILTEYFKGGSILNLLDITLTLPESVIRQVFSQVIKCLNFFYSQTDLNFGGLSPSQIMINDKGQIKLGMGLFYHITGNASYNVFYLRGTNKNSIFDFNSTHSKFMKSSIQKPLNLEVQRSIDIFKLGFIMLECAVGSFDHFEQSSMIYESLKFIFTEAGQKQVQRENVCCVLHSENYLLQVFQSIDTTDRTRRDRADPQKVINYIYLLKDRFSLHFINFLCGCLKLNHTKRSTLSDLQNHSFIVTPHDHDNRTVKIELNDLIVVSRGQNQQKFFESGTRQKIDKFIGHMISVLYACKRPVLTEILSQKEKVYELGKQIGMNSQILFKKLEEAINQIMKTAKP